MMKEKGMSRRRGVLRPSVRSARINAADVPAAKLQTFLITPKRAAMFSFHRLLINKASVRIITAKIMQ